MTRRLFGTISNTALTLALAGALVLCAGTACNRVDSRQGGDDASAAAAPSAETASGADEPTGPPKGSDIESLGPDADTRIYYQYIDARGAVRFAERLEDVPEDWRDRVGYLELDSPPPMSPADAQRVRDERYARANPKSTRLAAASGAGSTGRAMDRFEPAVILYYADWCGYCKKAKRHLDRQGVAYDLRDVDNPHFKQELVEKTGSRGIPVIEVDGRIMKGYNAQRLDELLDTL